MRMFVWRGHRTCEVELYYCYEIVMGVNYCQLLLSGVSWLPTKVPIMLCRLSHFWRITVCKQLNFFAAYHLGVIRA